MTERLEQRYCIKFCQKLGDSQVETIRKIQRVFGDDAMGITQIKEWYNRFKDGRTSVHSDARSGRPSTSRNDELIDQVRALVMQDRRVTVRELVEEVGISTGSVHSILTDDLAMRRVSAKRTSSFLATDPNFLGQTQHSSGSTGSLLSRHGSLRFLALPPPENAAERTRFESRDDIIRNTTAKLYSIRKEAFRHASNNGRTAGISVFTHKGTTSKGIRVADLQACKCVFPAKGRILFEHFLHSCYTICPAHLRFII